MLYLAKWLANYLLFNVHPINNHTAQLFLSRMHLHEITITYWKEVYICPNNSRLQQVGLQEPAPRNPHNHTCQARQGRRQSSRAVLLVRDERDKDETRRGRPETEQEGEFRELEEWFTCVQFSSRSGDGASISIGHDSIAMICCGHCECIWHLVYKTACVYFWK